MTGHNYNACPSSIPFGAFIYFDLEYFFASHSFLRTLNLGTKIASKLVFPKPILQSFEGQKSSEKIWVEKKILVEKKISGRQTNFTTIIK